MSLMTNDNIRFYPHDKLVAWLFAFVPKWIEPNHLTVLRLFLVPIVLFFLWTQSWVWALSVFTFAAFTDVLDGTLARTRSQITLWGTIADPAADKLLIGSVAVFLIWKGLHPVLCISLIVLELLIIANAFRRQQSGSYVSANAYGKTKLVFQVIGIGALLLFQVMPLAWLTPVAMAAFGLSLIFALFSLATYGL